MKNIRGFALGLVLGLALAVSAVGFAQDTKQPDQAKKAEACCAMEACCKGDSCAMKDHAQKDHSKNHADKDGCCCCCGGSESCDMKMKDHEAKSKG